ncbi:hypothetical protein FQN60_007770, partial [Etheostoma spectabile]
ERCTGSLPGYGSSCCHRKPGPEEAARTVTDYLNILEFGRMSALPAKPGLRHIVSEWRDNNHQLSATAQHERYVSNGIRQEGRSLRNETNCKTTWDESNTSRRLSDRVWDVARWKEALETCAQRVDEEMEALTLSKEQTEQALAATAVPLEVGSECLTLRDGRRGYELATDPVDEQLKKEVELIERVQQVLQQHIDKAFEQLCVLQEVRHQLTADLQNKMDALDIDMSCLSLTIKSPQISLKTNPTRIPSGSSTPEEWVQFSQYNVARAQEAMQVSQQMREDTSLTRAQLQNELDIQRHATEFALRKRKHQEEQARDELEWQIRNVQHGLVNEVQQLEATMMALKQKLSEAQHSLQKMKLHHSRMLQDLSRKQEALSLEQRTMNTRTRLTSPSRSEKTPVLLVPLTNSSGRGNLQLLAQ